MKDENPEVQRVPPACEPPGGLARLACPSSSSVGARCCFYVYLKMYIYFFLMFVLVFFFFGVGHPPFMGGNDLGICMYVCMYIQHGRVIRVLPLRVSPFSRVQRV